MNTINSITINCFIVVEIIVGSRPIVIRNIISHCSILIHTSTVLSAAYQ